MRALRETELANEWSLLQNQFDSYEKYSLLIKLLSVLIVSAAYFENCISSFIVFLILVLWLQDAIWKTYQSRIDSRLIQLENSLEKVQKREEDKEEVAGSREVLAYQYNSGYQKNRPSQMGLFLEYFSQAVRPTVAFPYAVLLAAIIYKIIC